MQKNEEIISKSETLKRTGKLQSSPLLKEKSNEIDEKKFENTLENSNEKVAYITIKDESLLYELIIQSYYFDEKLQIMTAETKNSKHETVEFVEKIWEFNDETGKFDHKKFVNEELVTSTSKETGHKLEEELESTPSAGFRVAYDPASCVQDGECCTFEGVTYNYCGKECGVNRDSGGGDPINVVDSCCEDHDRCLINNSDPCPCHNRLLECYGDYSVPGDTTMGLGIRGQATIDGCFIDTPLPGD